MIPISKAVYDDFSALAEPQIIQDMANLIKQSNPHIAERVEQDEFEARIALGVRVCRHYEVTVECDVMLICLAYVMLGADLLETPGLEWVQDILAEGPSPSDDRVLRIHERFKTVG